MSTNFGLAGIPGTYPLPYNTSPRLGAGTLMLNAWTGLLQYIFVKTDIFQVWTILNP